MTVNWVSLGFGLLGLTTARTKQNTLHAYKPNNGSMCNLWTYVQSYQTSPVGLISMFLFHHICSKSSNFIWGKSAVVDCDENPAADLLMDRWLFPVLAYFWAWGRYAKQMFHYDVTRQKQRRLTWKTTLTMSVYFSVLCSSTLLYLDIQI